MSWKQPSQIASRQEPPLIISDPGEEGAERGRIPMNIGLDDSVFSALISKVDSDAVYRVDFEEAKSETYTVTTFEHPRLEKSDATITPPKYVGKDARTIEDTRKVSLIEGSDLKWELKVNKPVAAAELFGEDESVIELQPSKSDPKILVASHIPDKTKKYRLHLVDDRDRSNKRPPWFTVTVKKNLPPKLTFVFPKRDIQVSAVQEFPVEAMVWDDVGVLQAGATFQYGEEEKKVVLVDKKAEGGKNHPIETLFNVEELGAKPRDLVSYHLWAEDIGPDGKKRRTSSDMFFAEVRHFEDIFREAQSAGGPPSEGQEGQTVKLLKLQKEILDASWKVLRRQQMGRTAEELADDISVLAESQSIAIEHTEKAIQMAEDPDLKALMGEAKTEMVSAVTDFQTILEKQNAATLHVAYNHVRKAYEKLIQARAREHQVTQSNKPPQSGQPQEKEAQLMNLELKQKELKYEEESKAQDPAANRRAKGKPRSAQQTQRAGTSSGSHRRKNQRTRDRTSGSQNRRRKTGTRTPVETPFRKNRNSFCAKPMICWSGWTPTRTAPT